MAKEIAEAKAKIVAGKINSGNLSASRLVINKEVPRSFTILESDQANKSNTIVKIMVFQPYIQVSTASLRLKILRRTPIKIATIAANKAAWNNTTEESAFPKAALKVSKDKGLVLAFASSSPSKVLRPLK